MDGLRGVWKMINQVTAVVLASGFSKRMGNNKLLLPIGGKPMIEHVFEAVCQADFAETIVVTAYDAIAEMADLYGFKVVRNKHPEKGQSYSVVLGVAETLQSDGWMFFNGDMPWLQADTIEILLRQVASERIVVPKYGESPGQPVYFSAAYREELLSLTGDHGGRTIMRSHPENICYVSIDQLRQGMDIDTPESYEKAKGEMKNGE